MVIRGTRQATWTTLSEFIAHCCRQRHYFFDILKCGKTECSLCKPPRLPQSEFQKLDHLPDPVMDMNNHYKTFKEVFRTKTSEDGRPSKAKTTHKERTLPFYPSVQHVKNTEMMLMCDECGIWRLIYSKRKLKEAEKKKLDEALDGMSFSCGAVLQDADIPDELKEIVYVRDLSCGEPVEKLYYSAKFTDICVYCAAPVPPWSDKEANYPQCTECSEKPTIENAKFRRQSKTVNTQ